MNFLYFTAGRMDIYHKGYGGLDNNGAGLMLAMGIPLALNAWEGIKKIWRWAFLAGVPLLLHAVLMSYSRGAMLSVLVATPLLIVRTRKRLQFTGAFILLVACVPVLAGQEIRARFFTLEDYQNDGSANSRFGSWQAAIKIANEYPVFGVGIRNSNLMSYDFGADMEGRTIHSQYFQTLADSGYVGLGLYLVALASAWLAMRRARKRLIGRTDESSRLAINLLNGAEGSLVVFCVGGAFLSLEVFELPYIVAFIGIQTAMLTSQAPEPSITAVPAPLLTSVQSRA
jgi:probable O-glycosylation ligase (exosortase A-associated)